MVSKGYGFGMGEYEYAGVNHVAEEVAIDIAEFINIVEGVFEGKN